MASLSSHTDFRELTYLKNYLNLRKQKLKKMSSTKLEKNL